MEILKNCFDNNADGSGYMYNHKGKVFIHKGFMNWEDFKLNFEKTCKSIDTKRATMVMHFRITTQGGVRKELCHPYPLSNEMEHLRRLHSVVDIGVAHNGIISLTSDRAKDYNDTMKFITDYLSLIIKDKKFYKDSDKLKLIERLCGSKLAILDSNGHCQLIGNFIEDNGVYYSNSSYSYSKKTYSYPKTFDWDAYYDRWGYDVCSVCNKRVLDYECEYDMQDNCYCTDCYNKTFGDENLYSYYDKYYNKETKQFEFDDGICPIEDGIEDYCDLCSKRHTCSTAKEMYIPSFTMSDGTFLTPTGELKRERGDLKGISIDEDGNEWEVLYDEYKGDIYPYEAYKL
jgi:predicted glutamine amidotransferase